LFKNDLLKQNSNSREKHKGEERIIRLIAAGCNTSKPLNFLEKTFDQMTLLVDVSVVVSRLFHVGLRWDCVLPAAQNDEIPDRFRPISLIAQNIALRDVGFGKQLDGSP
jgi:hypothetical protein